jgi:hypothetical protein
MKKRFLIVFPIASPYSKLVVAKRACRSIIDKFSYEEDDAFYTGFDYKLVFYVDESVCSGDIVNFAKGEARSNPNIVYRKHMGSWTKDVNQSIIDCVAERYDYLVLFHDDIFVETDGWNVLIDNFAGKRDDVGVITFTDTVYRKICSCIIPMREGYHIDSFNGAWSTNTLFQYHKFQPKWSIDKKFQRWDSILESKLDYPTAPVKMFASWSMVMIVPLNVLNSGVKFEDWTPWTLLNEADFNMQCIEMGYNNCYMPNICYEHHRENNIPKTRSMDQIIQYRNVAHAAFRNKWGFSHEPEVADKKKIFERFKNTTAECLLNTNSFDWQYFNE